MSGGEKVIASISGGKDSLAALITHIESGGRCDGAVYCRIMFDGETSAEYPEHEDFLFNKCLPTLEREYGIKTRVLQSDTTYIEQFYRKYQKGKNIGRIQGFPCSIVRGNWCTKLKTRPINAWKRETGKFTEIVGIAADEPKRIDRDTVKGKILPLVEHKITEAEAREICKKRGLYSPGYCGGRSRLGCWFCHNQRISELKRLYYDYPELWEKLRPLDRVSPMTFKPGRTLADFEKRFFYEGYQETLYSEGGGP